MERVRKESERHLLAKKMKYNWGPEKMEKREDNQSGRNPAKEQSYL